MFGGKGAKRGEKGRERGMGGEDGRKGEQSENKVGGVDSWPSWRESRLCNKGTKQVTRIPRCIRRFTPASSNAPRSADKSAVPPLLRSRLLRFQSASNPPITPRSCDLVIPADHLLAYPLSLFRNAHFTPKNIAVTPGQSASRSITCRFFRSIASGFVIGHFQTP